MKCDDLRVENACVYGPDTKVYLSEKVDAILAEKDKEIARLNDKALQYKVLDKEHCRDLNTQERRFALQIAHHKYKRCWDKVRICQLLIARYERYLTEFKDCSSPSIQRWKFLECHYVKWCKRWVELAEKFKEAK